MFILLIQEKLDELKIPFNIISVICDFELNIIKSIDDLLHLNIEGCFFHFSKALKTKIDKKGMKTRYEKDMKFQKFIKECGALAHLPLEDIMEGFEHIDNKFVFDDEEANFFKEYFLSYIKSYWIEGCYPPQIWNCWSRSEDLTNNNQEGYNAKTNRTIRQVHPSPGILLCHVRSEVKLAEQLLSQAKVGIEKPRSQRKYKELAQRRLKLKRVYEDEKKNGKKDIGSFLSNIGHNVMVSAATGRLNEEKKTKDPRKSFIMGDDGNIHNVSSWIPVEEPDLSIVEQGQNPYENRQVGKTKRTQEKEACPRIPWLQKKCPKCKCGFNKISKPIKCFLCDSFTHERCIGTMADEVNFHCFKCIDVLEKEVSTAVKPLGTFDCNFCEYKTRKQYNLRRHISRKHADESSTNSIENIRAASTERNVRGKLNLIFDDVSQSDLIKKLSD